MFERELIGSALQDSTLLDPERLPCEYFTDSRNRALWAAMLELRQSDMPVNLVTVNDAMNGSGPGPSYLAGCSDVGSAANAAFYVGKVIEAARLAALRKLFMGAADKFDRGASSEEILAHLEGALLEVQRRADTTATVRPEQALREVLDAAEARIKSGAEGPSGIPTGFPTLDSMTGGFQPGDLVLIGARTTIGKSALALSFIERQIESGLKIALASLEMSAVQVWQRLLAMRSLVNTGKLRFGHLGTEDFRALVAAANEYRGCGLAVIDKPSLSTASLRSWAAGMVGEGCSIVYVDYVGLMRGEAGLPRWEQMLEVSRSLKAIARELAVPLVGLVQLTREAADVREPGLQSIRDSGALEQDADVVLMLTRSEKETEEDSIPASLYLKKQRSGPVGKIALSFRKSLTQFREAENA